ncbi:MAG: AAA family ATPase [Deltaproteobacteria bacterium]|nr:AAA family ATPase [Deltaproteobacteria bacterium]
MTDFIRARNTREALWAFDPFAIIKIDDPRFVDFERVLPLEHYGVSTTLHEYLVNMPQRPKYVHLGVMGHQGTGKSTLVRKAMADLAKEGIMAIFVDAMEALDQGDFGFADVMLVIARAIIECLADQQIAVDPNVVKSIYDWFAEELLIEEHKRQIIGSIESSAEGSLELPFLAKFTSKIAGALRSDNEYRQEIRQRANRDIRALVRRVNQLLEGAHDALRARKQQLCVVLDNLEKIEKRNLVEVAVLQRTEEIRQLHCHVVLFLNPADEYSPGSTQASKAFPLISVPVLPVRYDPQEDGAQVRPEALKAVEWLLDRRVDLSAVFADPAASIEMLARYSGGHIRDILHLARRASQSARSGKIELTHIEKAARWLATSRTTLMKPEDWPRSVQIHRARKVQNRPEDARLLLHSCVLNYDGEPWWDVHPLVRADPQFTEAAKQIDE